ncbi:hypothetical protein Taro_002552 [Colocasia esculenta]|uniref:Uncharacterized protein n=1 Tax=Colocasia esculenta TaxID=4460 RepID=A0A843TD23_COLES|nr:hypothetical protein [Colocasia esculenta]
MYWDSCTLLYTDIVEELCPAKEGAAVGDFLAIRLPGGSCDAGSMRGWRLERGGPSDMEFLAFVELV